ncbi:MAG: recombinase family protein [Janthinobacterium lividum]
MLRAKGHKLGQIAAKLNDAGYRTRRGKEFQVTTVQRLLPPIGSTLADPACGSVQQGNCTAKNGHTWR